MSKSGNLTFEMHITICNKEAEEDIRNGKTYTTEYLLKTIKGS